MPPVQSNVAIAGSVGRIGPAERRTWEDRIAIHLPRLYRVLGSFTWRVFTALHPGHPVRRALAERITSRSYGAFNRNDLAALLPLYHPECVWDWSDFEGWPEEQLLRGPEGLRRTWETFREAWRDFHVEPSDLSDLGNRFMVTCHMRAVGGGSGVGIETIWWQVGEFRDGLIALVANYSDRREALEALGLSE